MKKLKLNLAHEAGEILSKEDMKKILGGAGSVSDPCENKNSITYCRGSDNSILHTVYEVGCSFDMKSKCPKGTTSTFCYCPSGSNR